MLHAICTNKCLCQVILPSAFEYGDAVSKYSTAHDDNDDESYIWYQLK
jgi:ferredoxin